MADDQRMVDAALRGLPSAEELGWDRLTAAQQCFCAMEVVEGQVGNGGFHALVYNNCRHYLPLAIDGYSLIGASGHARLARAAGEMMADDPWSGPPETWPDPGAESPPEGAGDIGSFDEPWWALDGGQLDRLKAAYIAANPEQFAGAIERLARETGSSGRSGEAESGPRTLPNDQMDLFTS
jgi:hypothetical protein